MRRRQPAGSAGPGLVKDEVEDPKAFEAPRQRDLVAAIIPENNVVIAEIRQRFVDLLHGGADDLLLEPLRLGGRVGRRLLSGLGLEHDQDVLEEDDAVCQLELAPSRRGELGVGEEELPHEEPRVRAREHLLKGGHGGDLLAAYGGPAERRGGARPADASTRLRW